MKGEGGIGRILPIIALVVAAVLLALGVSLPIMRFEQLYFFSSEPSLIEMITGLWADGSVVLALIVAAVSIVIPLCKLAIFSLDRIGQGARPGFLSAVLPHLGKWSMMDVMLVAIVIFAAKTSGLAKAVTLPGFWCYAASAAIAAVYPSVVKLGKTERPS